MQSSDNGFCEVPMFHVELVRDYSIKFQKADIAADAAKILHNLLDRSPVEKLVAMYLDCAGNFVGAEILSIGTADSTVVMIRDVFRGAILAGVTRIVIGHNHPSGECRPSIPDVKMTIMLEEAGLILQVKLWDHVIVSPNGQHYSMYAPENKAEMNRLVGQITAPQNIYGLPPMEIEKMIQQLVKI
jgi:DNA repair protein RadC